MSHWPELSHMDTSGKCSFFSGCPHAQLKLEISIMKEEGEAEIGGETGVLATIGNNYK